MVVNRRSATRNDSRPNSASVFPGLRSSITMAARPPMSTGSHSNASDPPGGSTFGRKGTNVQTVTKRARIAIDAMGGDNAPGEIVAGAILAHRDGGVELTLVGDEARIRPLLGDAAGSIAIVHVAGEIAMDAHATQALRNARGTSLGHVVE